MLRTVLRANAGFSTVTGLAGLILGGPIAEMFGVDQVWLIRLLGAGLLFFAAGVFMISRTDRPILDAWSAQVSIADLGWVAGTVLVVALGWLSTTGAVVMGVIAVAVLGLGLMQLRSRSAMQAV